MKAPTKKKKPSSTAFTMPTATDRHSLTLAIPNKAQSFERIGKVSTESVLKCTGKSWKAWIQVLDKAGARFWTHQEIVAFLKTKYKLGPWWEQGVTSGYELAIGRRIEGQNAKGEYMVTTTKSLPFSVAKAWSFLISDKGQALWLQPFTPIEIKPGNQFETKDGFFGEIRTLKTKRRIRMTWQDPDWEKHTTVQITLVEKSVDCSCVIEQQPTGVDCSCLKEKSILVIDHSQIQKLKTQTQMRARWKKAVNAWFEGFQEEQTESLP